MLTEAQLAERLNYITGSDSAIICGLSPFSTRLQLWMEKTGRVQADDLSGLNHIKFGNYMEDGVARWFEAESGKKLINESRPMMIHKSLPWMAGNVDRFIYGENAILECKTALKDDGWGNGENLMPPYYLMQVAHYCAVGAFDRAYVAVVFRMTGEMRWYVYERDLGLEEKLIAREQDFWINNVQADVAPEPVNEQDLLAMYKFANANPIIASKEIEEKIYALRKLQAESKAQEKLFEEMKLEVQMLMQDHDTLINYNGERLATWNFTKSVKSFDKRALEKEHPDIYNKYVVEKDPKRPFCIKIKE